jgi:hypothetical protein
MKNASWFISACLVLSLTSACSGRFPNAQRTLLSLGGYGVKLELLQSSASAPSGESEAVVGKWASARKAGTTFGYGTLAAPGPSGGGDWQAVTGGVAGTISVTRFAALPNGATTLLYRAFDTTTGAIAVNYNSTLTGLVSGRNYRVQAAWFGASGQLSEGSALVTVAAL